jgi:hypothetical protein
MLDRAGLAPVRVPRVTGEVDPVLTDTLGATLGGLAGLALGGPVGAIVGVAATPALAKCMSRILVELGRRGEAVAEAAVLSSDLSEAEVLECIVSDVGLQPLVSRVVEAVAHTDSHEKLRLLGTVLGEAISNRPTRLDEDFLIVAALDDLQPVHLRVMELLEQPANPVDADQRWYDGLIEERIVGVSRVGWQGALGGLIRHGLVRDFPGWGIDLYELSDFGGALIAVMRQVRVTPAGTN